MELLRQLPEFLQQKDARYPKQKDSLGIATHLLSPAPR